MTVTQKDIRILRELAENYMRIATLPIQKEKINLWKSLNRSGMQRPMVVIDQLPYNELNANGDFNCCVSDPFWRGIEWNLREQIYKWNHFAVDMVLDPFISIPMAISNSGYGISVKETTIQTDTTNSVVSHQFENQLVNEEDVSKIKDMVITHDESLSKQRLDEAAEIFKGIAPVKLSGAVFHLGVWDTISMVMGVENIYYEMMDRPEFIHAIMSRFTDSVLAGIEQCNKLMIHNDIANTCHCSYVYTDELLADSGISKGRISKNSWAFGLAQLFSSVSPANMDEFEIPYINKMAEQFGMIYYGCCDRLDNKLDSVMKIPNVRKISCSPWSDRDAFAEKIGKKLIMSNKPSPAFLATDNFDEDVVRHDLEWTYNVAKANNVNLEIILKDVSTIRYQPERLTRWAEIAMDVVSSGR